MAKTSTNISLDPELKRSSQELFADLGIDLSTAITLFLKQSLRVQGLPFVVTRENPNAETAAADCRMRKPMLEYILGKDGINYDK